MRCGYQRQISSHCRRIGTLEARWLDAGLNAEEKEALQKRQPKCGFPPKAWFAYKQWASMVLVLYQSIVGMDSKYFKEDFGAFPANWRC